MYMVWAGFCFYFFFAFPLTQFSFYLSYVLFDFPIFHLSTILKGNHFVILARPYVPLYGSGLCILYLLASIGEKNGVDTVGEKLLLFAGMALSMTAIEYIAGIVSLKFMHIRLWDYSKQWGNIQGLICPAFSVLWAAVSAVYYFCVHPYILDALDWLSRNLAFSFVIGFFFGVFTIDLVYSAKLVSRIRKFADEHDVVIKVENLKAHIRQRQEERREKYSFLFAYRSRSELLEHLREAQETWEERRRK